MLLIELLHNLHAIWQNERNLVKFSHNRAFEVIVLTVMRRALYFAGAFIYAKCAKKFVKMGFHVYAFKIYLI